MKKNLRNFKNFAGSLFKGGGLLVALLFGITSMNAQTAPVFNDNPDDLTVQCVEDVPTQTVLTATSDCEPVVVSTFVSHTGVQLDSCTLSSANDEWSIWLPALSDLNLAPSENWHFQGNATYISYDDNTASVSGVIVNAADASLIMFVELWLNNGMDWNSWSALGRNYKDDLGNGTTTHVDWRYYEMIAGYSHITGLGSLTGSDLFLSHEPSNYYYGFQCGYGANDKNTNMGMSGWFSFTGNYNGTVVTGAGDLNVDKTCASLNQETCINHDEFTYLWHAEDACGNMANYAQIISVEDTTDPVFTVVPENMTLNCQDWPIAVFDGIEAVDNCDSGLLSLVYEGEFVISETPCESQIVRRWVATDMCYNTSTYEQYLTVIDNEAPVFDGTLNDITIECDEEIPTDMLTATDNCSEPTIELEESITGDACSTILTRTFTATDACGLSTVFVQTITIEDTTPPVFDDFDMEVSFPCDEVVDVSLLTATDNCSGVEITYDDNMQSGGGCAGILYRIYTATDACGNTSTAQQFITLIDETPPVINAPEDMTVECDALPIAPDADIEITDNCTDIIDVSFDETTTTGECENSYIITWHWIATDACNNTAEATTTITVQDTTSPTWIEGTIPADVTFECSEDIPAYELPQAEDNCDNDVEVEVTEMIIDGDCPNSYSIERLYQGFDNCGNEVLAMQTITIIDTTAPTFDTFEDIEMPCDNIEEGIFVTATDNCSEVTITVIDETIEDGCAGQIIKTYTATDACGNTSTAIQTVTLTDTIAPVFDSYDPEIEVPCDEAPGSIYITASDNCSEVTITIEDEYLSGGCAMTMIKTYTATDACGNTSSIQQIIHLIDNQAPIFVTFPADVNIECDEDVPSFESGASEITIEDNCTEASLTFEGSETTTGDCPQNYLITYTWKVIDQCNNENYRTWTITVEDTTPPVFTSVPETLELNCADEIPVTNATAEDNCGVTTITFEDEISENGCEMMIVRTFTATDECGNTSSVDQLIIKTDTTPPVLTISEDMTLECDETIPEANYTIEDDCSDADVVVTSTIEDGDCPQAYIMTRIYTATDACGNETVLTQTLTIEDTTDPIFTFIPSDVTIDCSDALPTEMAEASDNCGIVTVVFEDESTGDSCEMITVRTFTAVDECGNQITATQTITQLDTTAPALTVGENMYLECDETIPDANYTVNDNCSDVSVDISEETVEGDCPQAFVITRTYMAVDACGNSTTMTQVITVNDTTAPTFISVPDDVTIDCGDDLPTEMATANDNCGTVTVTFVDTTTGDSCEMITERTFTATDECGNTSTAIQTITKLDTIAPELEIADDVIISCEETIPTPEYTVSDNCSGALVEVTETIDGGDYCYEITRTYVATDACGNSTSPMIQVITVEDNEAPQIVESPENQTYTCPDDVPTFEDCTSIDNCDPAPTSTTEWQYISQDDCGNYVAIVTCTATDACENSSSVSFMVTVQDDIAPEFVNELEDLIIDCDDDIPTSSTVNAIDNCGGDVTYTVNDEIIGELPNPDALLECNAITPPTEYYDVDWGMMMYNDGEPMYTEIIEASFTEFPDGTAHLVATLISTENANGGYFADVWFMDAMDWANWSTQAFPTGYKDQFNIVGDNYLDWTYYLLNGDNATMIGWGDYEGSFFALSHAPSNYFYGFQIGVGANNVNMNYGGGGWFTYEGTFVDSSTGTNENITGGGDFAWDGDCCPDYMVERTYCATDCSGNETCFTQQISFDDLDGIVGGVPMTNTVVETIELTKSFDFVSITPNPVSNLSLIEFRSNIDSQLNLDVVDAFGHKVDVIFTGDVKANTTYRKYISTTHLSDGIYLLRLSSDDESTSRRIVVTK